MRDLGAGALLGLAASVGVILVAAWLLARRPVGVALEGGHPPQVTEAAGHEHQMAGRAGVLDALREQRRRV